LFLAVLSDCARTIAAATGKAAIAQHGMRAKNVYGPGGCVKLGLSQAGSCTLGTNCAGHDISQFEFSFDCQAGSGTVRHSFGVGGFDENEDFDTEVKCDSCSVPLSKVALTTAPRASVTTPQPVAISQEASQAPHLKAAPPSDAEAAAAVVAAVARAAAEDEDTDDAAAVNKVINVDRGAKQQYSHEATNVDRGAEQLDSHAVSYGPNNCVSTYRSNGHCVMKTSCAAADIESFEFGLVCIDNEGAPVRHLFGKNSFDPAETYDTQISCEKCLGLEDMPGDMALSGRVSALSDEVKGLETSLVTLTTEVKELDGKFLGNTPKAKPKPRPESDTGDTPKPDSDTDDEDTSNFAALPQVRSTLGKRHQHHMRHRRNLRATTGTIRGSTEVTLETRRHHRKHHNVERTSSLRHHRRHQRSDDVDVEPGADQPAPDLMEQPEWADESAVEDGSPGYGDSRAEDVIDDASSAD